MTAELAPPSGDIVPPGWYADPTAPDRWRWWNGHAWTTFTADPAGARRPRDRPRLPRWLSVPVVVCAPFVALLIGVLAYNEPISVVAALVPLAIVLPVLSWLDRVEPEPVASRVHAVLWGACVAVLVSIVANVLVAVLVGDLASMVVSAPVVEEAAKGAGIVWALRRREVDGITDGVVYAGWIALGFAVVEDMTYFSLASIDGDLLPVFIVRAVLTPFAHPLFTFWIGLALGRAVQRGQPVFPSVLWGYALAVGTHAVWNGALAVGEIRPDVTEDVAAGVVLATGALFVVLFVAVSIALVVARRREQRRFVRMWPFLMQRYDLADSDFGYLDSWSSLRQARRDVPRRARRSFDEVHAVLARLAMQHERLADLDPDDERVLVAQLTDARADLAEKTAG